MKERPDEASAMAAAKQANHRVEVSGQRSRTQQVFANPDGTFTAEISAVPKRVQRADGSWVPVDATLRERPDGTVAPEATSMPMAFSGGGDAPLVRFGSTGEQVTLGWPRPLPKPTVSGDTATYPEVLPGVDLRLQARVQGFSETLVIKSRQAAANPDLATLRLSMRTAGVTVQPDADGNLLVVNGSGRTVFAAPRPLMWDAADQAAGAGSPAASSAGTAATSTAATPSAAAERRQAVVRTAIGSGELRLMPDRAMLADPATRFPVSVDPDFTDVRDAWTKVSKNFPDQTYWNGANDSSDPRGNVKVGHESQDGTTWRSFFRMNTSPINSKQILSATFRAFEGWAWSCTAWPIELWLTGGISTSTNWAHQPAFSSRLSTVTTAKGWNNGGASPCPADMVEWNATNAIRSAAAANAPGTTFGLVAGSESDTRGWKRFRDSDVQVTVNYNSFPDKPTVLATVPTTPCVTESGRPFISTARPNLKAKITDPDRTAVRARFEWWNKGGSTPVGGVVSVAAVSGTTFTATIPAGAFRDGSIVSWRVRGEDGVAPDGGPWSAWCEFTVDSTPPNAAPGVSSVEFPNDNGFHDGVGKAGTFTFTANGVTDAAKYVYSLSGGLSKTVAAKSLGGPATVSITPTTDGPNTLKVSIMDRAGNTNPNLFTEYKFGVSRAAGPVGYWRFDERSGTTVEDSSVNDRTATFSGAAIWSSDHYSMARPLSEASSVSFDGLSGQAATAGPVVRTDRSFSVSAWVLLRRKDADFQTAVSQDGTQGAGFYLQYVKSLDRWRFAMISADTDSFATHAAVSDAPPELLNRWTQLVGVYDAAAGQLRLYVDGRLAGSGAHSAAWNATGPLRIGAAKGRGVVQNFWSGQIDEVRVYDRILIPDPGPTDAGDSEVQDLVNQPTALGGRWPLDGAIGTDDGAAPSDVDDPDASGDPVSDPGLPVPSADSPSEIDPNGDPAPDEWTANVLGRHNAKLSPGVEFVPGHTDNALRLNGVDQVAVAPSVVSSFQSYTVSAWVRLDKRGQKAAAVSQDGSRTSAFSLLYRPSADPANPGNDRWSFVVADADLDAPVLTQVNSVEPPAVGEGAWTHLVGVYDRGRREIRLYVNGVLQGRVAFTSKWTGLFALNIGDAKWKGAQTNFWPGDIDDVQVHQGVLTDFQIQQLAFQ